MNQITAAFHERGETQAEPAVVESHQALRLLPRTPEAEKALQKTEMEITKTPFNIGRFTKDGAFENVDLRLLDREPHQLSRIHCTIVFLKDRHYLIDTSSTLGTTVDGVRIGKREEKKNVILEKGRHEIVLGSPNSPYRFSLDIPER
jgi:pSer/pThr/pTyr-binding forkhead associated (FHA) protein